MAQHSMRLVWARKEVDNRLKIIMKGIHQTPLEVAEQCGTPGNYVNGANIVGFVKGVDDDDSRRGLRRLCALTILCKRDLRQDGSVSGGLLYLSRHSKTVRKIDGIDSDFCRSGKFAEKPGSVNKYVGKLIVMKCTQTDP
jgi:hypothetical protein